ncbi:hypothetical protein [Gimesia sp.]|uniref:hypothetical protein n=1 Tax=Gimesia sp. TaxID=2024833 RepID=UPI003A95526F
MNPKVDFRKIISRLHTEGSKILRSNIRRRVGFYDSRIHDWLKECETELTNLQQSDVGTINSIIATARHTPETRTLERVQQLLQDVLLDEPWKQLLTYEQLTQLALPDIRSISVIDRECFVIMPFARKFIQTYRDAIKPALETVNCTSVRADEVAQPGVITMQLFYHIARSHLCIADISEQNPNVMYELGVAHTLAKPTIILTSSPPDAVPFDVAHYRFIRYQLTALNGMDHLRAHLLQSLSSVLSNTMPARE